MNEVHSLCCVLGVDFAGTVNNVHPSLNERDSEKSTNISDSTLEGLSREVSKLRAEKKIRFHKVLGGAIYLVILFLFDFEFDPLSNLRLFCCSCEKLRSHSKSCGT